MPKIPPLLVLMALLTCGIFAVNAAAPQEKGGPAADDLKNVVAGNNQFALELYGHLREKPGNILFSPYSISATMAMAYAGARGPTADEMAAKLHFTLPGERLHAAMAKLQADLDGGDKKRAYQLSVVNSIWGQKKYGYLPDFLKLTRTYYGSAFNEVSFSANAEAARKTINDAVAKQTQDKFKELVKKGVVDEDMRMVLASAVYFTGDWTYKFDKAKTARQVFTLSSKQKPALVDMMQIDVTNLPKDKDQQAAPRFRYHQDDGLQALELPYAGKELAMVILLPKEKGGLAAIEKKLKIELLQKLLDGMREHPVAAVSVPRFKMTSELELSEALLMMGMGLPLVRGQADFSGMNGQTDRLYIGAVVHKASVEVNEDGTESAVAALPQPSSPPSFSADHPFLFLIRDNRTGAFLFMGRVADPRKT